MTEKIILDVDPGHDDAVAMMLAAGNPHIELLAITTVAGNQTLPKVTRNALAVATVAGITDVPIAAGCDRPLVRPQIVAEDIHGDTGLDGPVLPEPTVTLDPRHAVDLIIELIMSHDPGTISLVPVGPLTNIAMAARREPRIVERVKQVVLMGGAYTRGNRTPAAEFNIIVDPEAAQVVFSESWPVTMVGLDLTHQAGATEEVFTRVAAQGTELSEFVVAMLRFFQSTYKARQGLDEPPVHDPCAVARIIDPSVFTTRDAFVTVDLTSPWTYGMTVTDFDGAYGQPANTQVAITLDRDKFWDMTIEAIAALGTH